MVEISFSTGVGIASTVMPELVSMLTDDHIDNKALITGVLTALAGFSQGHVGREVILQILGQIEAGAVYPVDRQDFKVH